MKYTRPDVGNNCIAYRGRRYWVIELAGDDNFLGWESLDCNFVLYDCLDVCPLALIDRTDDGKFVGKILSHHDTGEFEYDNLQEAASGLSAVVDWYAKAIS